MINVFLSKIINRFIWFGVELRLQFKIFLDFFQPLFFRQFAAIEIRYFGQFAQPTREKFQIGMFGVACDFR